MIETIGTNRESWLAAATEALRPAFAKAGFPIPDAVRVSCGFPSRGGLRGRSGSVVLGECWGHQHAADNAPQIFISPAQADTMSVAAILAHELAHAATPGAKHGPRFVKAVRALGLEGKATATVAGPAFRELWERVGSDLGEYPHAALDARAGIKKQTTRLIKGTCNTCEMDGTPYFVRLSRAAIESHGFPICPRCETPMEEGI